MREHYDFSQMEGRKNPYAKQLRQQVTLQIDRNTVAFFKDIAREHDIPYQKAINMFLRDCALRQKKLRTRWVS